MIEINKEELKDSIIELLKVYNVMDYFGEDNCNLIINSIDNEAALPYILDLCRQIDKWKNSSMNDSYFALSDQRYQIKQNFERLRVFLFKQRKILLAVPQRKRHPDFPAPNLGGLIIPQAYRAKGEVTYGMGYCEARRDLVFKALSDPSITDILFIDDDILLSLDTITILCESNESIIGCNYVKKQFPIESTALAIKDNHNQEVKPNKADLTPIAVSQMGLGACLISVEVFKKLPEPWFEFVYNDDGSVFASEDVRFFQKAILAGYIPKVIPGLVPVHVSFEDGSHWGPDWLVKDFQIKEEFKQYYCHMQCDPEECFADNIKE